MLRQFSAGGIIFRVNGQKIEWLIRRPAPNPGFTGHLGWNLPRGLIDEGEKMEEAALREVREEAGVGAKIIEKLPSLKIFYTNNQGEKIAKFITFFLMEWVTDLPGGFGWETAEIKWVSIEEAQQLLAHSNEKKLLIEAEKLRNFFR